MSLFDSLFGRKGETNTSSARAANWTPSEAHLLLLSKFLVGQQLDHMTGDYWHVPLRELPEAAIARFIAMGWLVSASLAQKLESRFNAGDLKPLLKSRRLRVSGRKGELIDRLIAADEAGMSALVADMKVYQCSPEARARAEQYRLEQAQVRAAAEASAVNQLRARDFRGASLTVSAYESVQVFPRGIGIDWSNPNTFRDVALLTAIFELRPRILDGLAEGEWEPLRVAAGMMALWGTNSVKGWLPESFVGVPKFDADTAGRMLLFAANHNQRLDEYRGLSRSGIGIKGFEICVVPDSCPECKRLAGKRYRLNELPDLPYSACTHHYGCRCMAMPVLQP